MSFFICHRHACLVCCCDALCPHNNFALAVTSVYRSHYSIDCHSMKTQNFPRRIHCPWDKRSTFEASVFEFIFSLAAPTRGTHQCTNFTTNNLTRSVPKMCKQYYKGYTSCGHVAEDTLLVPCGNTDCRELEMIPEDKSKWKEGLCKHCLNQASLRPKKNRGGWRPP